LAMSQTVYNLIIT